MSRSQTNDSLIYGGTTAVPLRALETNYIWLLNRTGLSSAIVVDASDAPIVERLLARNSWSLTAILSTHHHHDHVGGNLQLKKSHGCEVLCSERDLGRIPGATRAATEGELLILGGLRFESFLIPGHTEGQIAWYLRDDGLLFVGDTVFAFGCGRLFEGTAADLHHSLSKIALLPPETRLFYGHEYAETNAAFALEVEPGNDAIRPRLERIRQELDERGYALPPTLAEELATNPFFRAEQPEIRARLGLTRATNIEVFSRLRAMKDSFKT